MHVVKDLQQPNNVFDLVWADAIKHRHAHHETEVQWARCSFEQADVAVLAHAFQANGAERTRLFAQANQRVTLAAYDSGIRVAHEVKLFDAHSAVSAVEQPGHDVRVWVLERSNHDERFVSHGSD